MKQMLLSSSFALVATVFTLDVPAYGNERAPYDPIVAICPGVYTVSSQMEKIAHSADLQKEACELYEQIQPSDEELDIATSRGVFLRLYVDTANGQKGTVSQIQILR